MSKSVNARVTDTEHSQFHQAADKLRVDLSRIIKASLNVVSGRILSEGWSARRIWLDDGQIVMLGEQPPTGLRGLPANLPSFVVIAPDTLWKHLERLIEKP